MPSTPLDLSRTGKPARIQENLIAYMRLFAGLPGMVMRDDDIFWFVCGRGAPGDTILRARWPEEGVEERIDQTLAEIGRYIDGIDWSVYPGDSPPDLGRRLAARGMPEGLGGNWLWTSLADLGPGPAVPDGFHVERVTDDRMMKEWVEISEAGFGGDLACFYDAYARHGYGPGAFSIHYTGYLGDTPVTSGTLLDAGGWASIYDVSTPPALRRQGLGGAITHALMREIRRRGYTDTWIWSSNIGKSVYQKLGFVDADFGMREYGWRKT
jgi:GNAT superfamily N-acetyltransferase